MTDDEATEVFAGMIADFISSLTYEQWQLLRCTRPEPQTYDPTRTLRAQWAGM
jgi:hypothetical protein